MEISKGIQIQDLALFFSKEKVLIIGDLHIGQEAVMQKEGILIPRFQHHDLKEKTQKIINATNPELIILNGDVKHEFSGISREEWTQTLEYLDLLKKHAKVIIIKGNHDTIIEPIAEKKGIKVVDYYSVNDAHYICHGDIIPTNEAFARAKTIIIGHEHPAIGLRDGNRIEKYKCFMKGKFKSSFFKEKSLIVMPSMNQLTEGTDVLNEQMLSPFLQKSIDSFETWIVEKEIYYFGKLKGLRKKYL